MTHQLKKHIGSFILKLAIILFFSNNAFAQPNNEKLYNSERIHWDFESKKVNEKEYYLVFKTKFPGRHLYSQFQVYSVDAVGPMRMEFTYQDKDGHYSLIGGTKEIGKLIKDHDKEFDLDVAYFENQVIFKQHIKLLDKTDKIKVALHGQHCANTCDQIDFTYTFDLTKATKASAEDKKDIKEASTANIDTATHALIPVPAIKDSNKITGTEKASSTTTNTGPKDDKSEPSKAVIVQGDSLWVIFINGFIGGIFALLMPCLYPMIPLTVSFFLKKDDKGQVKTSGSGIFKAIVFGLSIILIYVALGMIITILFGPAALNEMSSNATFNLIFFVVFILFALSFFGAITIGLPASWSSKTDALSERGGFIGIFFVAFTLAIVSFSCTGPIIGNLLVAAAKDGDRIGPMTGMFGFSLALAIPFTVFAVFPSLMRTLPKSGGWLNSVKIFFGFVELALAFKFFSNVDMSYHWDFFKREYFLIIWIILSAMLGFYLLGKLRFHHDTKVEYVTIPRLFLSIIFLGFALYMTTGLFGAPLNMLSGLQPPVEYSEWRQSGAHYPDNDVVQDAIGYTPLDLPVYFNYEQALAKAKQYKKPLMVDFTGFNCANCRKMEQNVWSDNVVLKSLKDDYIVVSLHTDDKRALPKEKAYTNKDGKLIDNLGRRWSDLEISRFGASTQPLYVLLDHNEQKLSEPVSVTKVENFRTFLREGKEEFAKRAKH